MCVASFCIRHHYPNQELQKSSSGHQHPVCRKEAMSVSDPMNESSLDMDVIKSADENFGFPKVKTKPAKDLAEQI